MLRRCGVRAECVFAFAGFRRPSGEGLLLDVGWLCVWGLCAGLYVGARSFLLHDERFVIPSSSSIEFQGNAHVTRAQLLSIFGEDVERNIFMVSLPERRGPTRKAAVGGACDGDAAAAEPDAGVGCGEDASGVCAAGKPYWTSGCERRAAGYAGGGEAGWALLVSCGDGDLGGRSAVDACSADEDL